MCLVNNCYIYSFICLFLGGICGERILYKSLMKISEVEVKEYYLYWFLRLRILLLGMFLRFFIQELGLWEANCSPVVSLAFPLFVLFQIFPSSSY